MKVKRIIVLISFVVIVACSAAMTLKAAIGVGAYDAIAQTGNYITGIEVGTIGMICNFTCIFIQILVLKKDFKKIQLLQAVVNVILGSVVNFMLYTVYSHFTIDAYWMNVVVLIIAYTISAFAVGAVMVLDIVTFSLEGACMAVSKVTGKKFHVLRQGVDIVSIVLVIGLSLIFNVPFSVREGTVIGMFIFGPLMGIFMKIQKPIFKKLDLIDYN